MDELESSELWNSKLHRCRGGEEEVICGLLNFLEVKERNLVSLEWNEFFFLIDQFGMEKVLRGRRNKSQRNY